LDGFGRLVGILSLVSLFVKSRAPKRLGATRLRVPGVVRLIQPRRIAS
jgi:hypothetical protein